MPLIERLFKGRSGGPRQKERTEQVKQFTHPVYNFPVSLGKKAPRLDHRNLRLADYIKALPPAPTSASFWAKVPSWPMYLNDQLGDCTIAAAGHMIQQWTEYAAVEKTITNNDVLKGYEACGGYVPGDPSTDNGCEMLTVVKYWQKTGLGGHKIAAFVAVDPTKLNEIKQAVALFGSVYLGVQLPISAQSQVGPKGVWAVPSDGAEGDGSPGSWGGHCIPIIRYGNTLEVITWGAPQMMSWPFLSIYADEAYAIVTQDFIEKSGDSPSGLALAALMSDLKQVQSA